MAGKKVTKTEGGALAAPSFMDEDRRKGTESLGNEAVEVPRVKFLQATSSEVQDYDEAEPGQFWHDVTNEPLGEELLVVPVWVDRRFLLWRPLDDGGGILARAADGRHWQPSSGEFLVKLKGVKKPVTWTLAPTVAESGLGEWGSSNPEDEDSPPAATLTYTYVCVMPDRPELGPMVFSLSVSSAKVAKKWQSAINMSRAPSFGQRFKLSSFMDNNSSNQDYFNYRPVADGFVQDEDEYAEYKGFYEAFRDAGVRIKDEDRGQDDTASDDTPDGAPSI